MRISICIYAYYVYVYYMHMLLATCCMRWLRGLVRLICTLLKCSAVPRPCSSPMHKRNIARRKCVRNKQMSRTNHESSWRDDSRLFSNQQYMHACAASIQEKKAIQARRGGNLTFTNHVSGRFPLLRPLPHLFICVCNVRHPHVPRRRPRLSSNRLAGVHSGGCSEITVEPRNACRERPTQSPQWCGTTYVVARHPQAKRHEPKCCEGTTSKREAMRGPAVIGRCNQ